MDQFFFFTILVIFLSGLIGVVVQKRSRDRCLSHFSSQPVTLELGEGRQFHGILHVYASGIEIFLAHGSADSSCHESVIIYGGEFDEIRLMARRMGEYEARGSRVELTPWRRFLRETQNVLNTFRDAFQQAFGVALLQAQKGKRGAILKGPEKNIKKAGGDVLGVMANAYEPILEKYLGKSVVVELEPDSDDKEETPQHIVGVLHEYTRTWIELHRVDHPRFKNMDLILPRKRAFLRYAYREGGQPPADAGELPTKELPPPGKSQPKELELE